MLRIVNLASVERHARAVLLRVVDKFESVVSRARATAQNADDEVRIVLRQFLHCLRSVINDFQKVRPPGFRHTSESAKNVVVDEFTNLFWRNAGIDVGIKDFEEMPKLFPLRFLAKFLVPKQR